jgi:hypothetical protein
MYKQKSLILQQCASMCIINIAGRGRLDIVEKMTSSRTLKFWMTAGLCAIIVAVLGDLPWLSTQLNFPHKSIQAGVLLEQGQVSIIYRENLGAILDGDFDQESGSVKISFRVPRDRNTLISKSNSDDKVSVSNEDFLVLQEFTSINLADYGTFKARVKILSMDETKTKVASVLLEIERVGK